MNNLRYHPSEETGEATVRRPCSPGKHQGMRPEAAHVLAGTRSLTVVHCLGHQSNTPAKTGDPCLQPTAAYAQRQTVAGIGTTWAQTIVWATGALGRYPTVGHDASYGRCGGSPPIRNGKRQGPGHVKNGP